MPAPFEEQNINISTVCFWKDLKADLDLDNITQAAMSVKGFSHHNPLRFLEVFTNIDEGNVYTSSCQPLSLRRQLSRCTESLDKLRANTWGTIEEYFIPIIPQTSVYFNEAIHHPPYCWRDCSARTLAVNFTYNTNALSRIINQLSAQGIIPSHSIEHVLDMACECLSLIYKANDAILLKNMNNNFSMYLVPKVIEYLLGKDVYDANYQESEGTSISLMLSLEFIKEYALVSPIEIMGISLGKGVSFIEDKITQKNISVLSEQSIKDIYYQYFKQRISIDHRNILLDMIESGGQQNNSFQLAVILDDTSESVDDLYWMLLLMKRFPFFRINVLINIAQVSINFSYEMLLVVLKTPLFSDLSSRFGSQFNITKVYCPFMSYQTNLLTPAQKAVIDNSDAIYIKGASFFETCQFPHKETFYAFVVYGPITRKYSGLQDFDAVFAYIPSGLSAYTHHDNEEQIVTLREVVAYLTKD